MTTAKNVLKTMKDNEVKFVDFRFIDEARSTSRLMRASSMKRCSPKA